MRHYKKESLYKWGGVIRSILQNVNRCNKKEEIKKIIKFEFRVALYGKYAIIPYVDRAPASEILEPHRGAARSRIQAGE